MIYEITSMDEQLKQTLREKLQTLSKDELIEIIANVSSVYVAMNVLGRVNALDSVQQSVHQTQFDLMKTKVMNANQLLDRY